MKKIKNILTLVLLAIMIVSCSQENTVSDNQGYLTISVSALESTNDPNTRAGVPAAYDPRTLSVDVIDQSGNVVKSTKSFTEDPAFQDPILLEKGTYTIVAHSADWDGNGAGFDAPYYYGETTVTVKAKYIVKANITCTQANVKVTVNYDESFLKNFKSAKTIIAHENLGLDDKLEFVMKETTRSGYIPAGNFTATLGVVNYKGNSNTHKENFLDAKPRDHYILNFKLKNEGYVGSAYGSGIEVEVDESTNTYTFAFDVPRKSSISLIAKGSNTWSTFAYLNSQITAKTSEFDYDALTMEWREVGVSDWTEITRENLSIDDKDNVTTTLKGLNPETQYEYRLCYKDADNELSSDAQKFTTESQIPLYNGGFEYWHKNNKAWYANESGKSYWDSSNPGPTKLLGENYNVTTSTENPKKSGTYAAQLKSSAVAGKFAAASLYTGLFGATIGMNGAWLTWGTSFVGRPTALKGYMQYHPQNVNYVGSGVPSAAPSRGQPDVCSIFFALLTETIRIDNTDMSTLPNWATDNRVIAYGELPVTECVATGDNWKEIHIPLEYKNLEKKPVQLLVVFSASKYGDYFHGGEGSTLYLDDFSLEYGDQPEVKE